MTIKLFVSSVSGSKEVKKQQQHALFVLTSHNIDFKLIDLSDPTYEQDKQLMLDKGKPNSRGIIAPPQIFNEDEYCGVCVRFHACFSIISIYQAIYLDELKFGYISIFL